MSGGDHNQADPLDLDAIERTAGRMYEALRSHGYGSGLGTLSRDVPALVAEVRSLRAALSFKRGTIADLSATVERLEDEASA